MLSVIGDNLKKELAAIEAGDRGKPFAKHLHILLKLCESKHCENAWRIAENKIFKSRDGQIYLAEAILSALTLGEYNYSIRSQQIEDLKKNVQSLNLDNDWSTETLRKFEIETPWASRKSGKEWPRTCFVHLTGLALFKLDGEIRAIEVMQLTNETRKFEYINESNVRKLLKGIDQIAEQKTAVATHTISYTPDYK